MIVSGVCFPAKTANILCFTRGAEGCLYVGAVGTFPPALVSDSRVAQHKNRLRC